MSSSRNTLFGFNLSSLSDDSDIDDLLDYDMEQFVLLLAAGAFEEEAARLQSCPPLHPAQPHRQ
jgi:hypothetical protein